MVWERSTTDMMCCGVFGVFIFGMVVISGVGISSGNPSVIFTPFDSDGNMCGQDKQLASFPNSSDLLTDEFKAAEFDKMRDFREYKYKFFTNLNAFSIDTDKSVEENLKAFDNPLIYHAVCVKECPTL